MSVETKGVSVLDSMAGAILERKSERAKKTLTPVAGEVKAPPGTPVDRYPEALVLAATSVTALITQTEQFLRQLKAAETAIGQADFEDKLGPSSYAHEAVVEKAEMPADTQKAVERAADAAHASKREAVAAVIEEEEAELSEEAAGAMESLAVRMARLSKKAQAETFTQPGMPVALNKNHPNDGYPYDGCVCLSCEKLRTTDPVAVVAISGWQCPEHGKFITKVSARRGREYRACPETGCAEFERL